jgi:hypothetical protein
MKLLEKLISLIINKIKANEHLLLVAAQRITFLSVKGIKYAR